LPIDLIEELISMRMQTGVRGISGQLRKATVHLAKLLVIPDSVDVFLGFRRDL